MIKFPKYPELGHIPDSDTSELALTFIFRIPCRNEEVVNMGFVISVIFLILFVGFLELA